MPYLVPSRSTLKYGNCNVVVDVTSRAFQRNAISYLTHAVHHAIAYNDFDILWTISHAFMPGGHALCGGYAYRMLNIC